MTTSTLANTSWTDGHALSEAPYNARRTHRIMAALGLSIDRLPKVDDETLLRYYRYLSARLSFPFTACYPEPKTPAEYNQFRCAVLELLDPTKYLGDGFDGIFCKVRKGNYEVNLPLFELILPQDDPNFQLIDDFWYWFWKWRF